MNQLRNIQHRPTEGQVLGQVDIMEVLEDLKIIRQDLNVIQKELTGLTNFVIVTIDHLEKLRDGKS